LIEEIWKERNIDGKNPLLISRLCFESNIDIHCSEGHTNIKQKSEQNQAKKREQLIEVPKQVIGKLGWIRRRSSSLLGKKVSHIPFGFTKCFFAHMHG